MKPFTLQPAAQDAALSPEWGLFGGPFGLLLDSEQQRREKLPLTQASSGLRGWVVLGTQTTLEMRENEQEHL